LGVGRVSRCRGRSQDAANSARFLAAKSRLRAVRDGMVAERAKFEQTVRLFKSYDKLVDLALTARPPSAIEPSLRFTSPGNGHNAEDARRFSAQKAEDLSNWAPRACAPIATSPRTAGFLAALKAKSLETRLVGWGGRNRTSEWRNQNPLPYRLATPQCFACA
jgi:hypothetical protein